MSFKSIMKSPTSGLFPICASVLLVFVNISRACAYSNHSYIEDNSQANLEESTKYACIHNVTTLHYYVHIDPIRLTKNCEKNNNCMVSASTKIRFQMDEITCNATENVITFHPRGCNISTEKVQVHKLRSNEPYGILTDQEKNLSGSCTTTDVCVLNMKEMNFHSGDILELYIPYTLKLTRDPPSEPWQGLHFYERPNTNSSSDLYQLYPLSVGHMFPVFHNLLEKIPFTVSVSRSESDGFVALSNMDVEETTTTYFKGEDMKGWVTDKFRESPPLAVDQLSVLIMNGLQKFEVANDKSQSVNVWVVERSDKDNNSTMNDAYYTAKEIIKLLSFFENLFNGTDYPLNKIDFVAVPWYSHSRHSSLGFATIGEWGLLHSEEDEVSGHTYDSNPLCTQIAFQWIGGIVTSRVSQLGSSDDSNTLNPAVGVLEYLTNLCVNMGDDTSEQYYSQSTETQLLETLEDVFPQNILISAITTYYVPTMKWKNAFPKDFYKALQQAIQFYNASNLLPVVSGVEVEIAEIFNSWTNLHNYFPLIYVRITGNNSNGSVSISHRNALKYSDSGAPWWVPIKISSGFGTENSLWLPPDNSTITWSWPSSSSAVQSSENDWLIVNPKNGRGYYRVDYGPVLLQKIIDQLDRNYTHISWKARMFLIENQFALIDINADWNSVEGALQMTKFLRKERNLKVWTSANDQLTYLHDRLKKNQKELKPFQAYVGSLINSVLEDIKLTPVVGEEESVSSLRTTLMRSCSIFQIPACVKYSFKLIDEWKSKPEVDLLSSKNIPYYIREELYCVAIQSGSDDDIFYFLLKQLMDTAEESGEWGKCNSQLARALACAPKDTLLIGLLNSKIFDEGPWCLQHIFREKIPYEILNRRPYTMTRAVYEFWMRELLRGKIVPASFMRYLWSLVPEAEMPPGFADTIVKFLEDNSNLFPDDLDDNVASFKVSIRYESKPYNRNELFWNGTRAEIIDWVTKNMLE